MKLQSMRLAAWDPKSAGFINDELRRSLAMCHSDRISLANNKDAMAAHAINK